MGQARGSRTGDHSGKGGTSGYESTHTPMMIIRAPPFSLITARVTQMAGQCCTPRAHCQAGVPKHSLKLQCDGTLAPVPRAGRRWLVFELVL